MEVREKYIYRLINTPEKFGLTATKFIYMNQVFTSRATRMRCQYSCSMTRQCDKVPPLTFTAPETKETLAEFKFGIMVRQEVPLTSETNIKEVWEQFSDTMIKVERACQIRGYGKAAVLFVGNCLYCHHDDSLRSCDYTHKARPTCEAIGLELKSTLETIIWEDHLVRDEEEPFQLFSLLCLE